MTNRRRTMLGTVAVGVCALALWAVPAIASAAQYVALGDSYSSGVGTRTYYNDGTSCDRSPDAYGPLIAADYGLGLSFQACSGAKTTDVINNQLGPLGTDTQLVTITIGGNDAGFSSVIEDCTLWYFNCQGAINNANSFITNTLPGLLDNVYSDIYYDAPYAEVVVLGYPHLFTASGTTCNVNTLTSTHAKELNQTADLLDGVIANEAAAWGFVYVDSRSAFATHEICSSSEWLNGQSWPISESYHPNIAGQNAFRNLIEAGAL